jgi:hypothetical protein
VAEHFVNPEGYLPREQSLFPRHMPIPVNGHLYKDIGGASVTLSDALSTLARRDADGAQLPILTARATLRSRDGLYPLLRLIARSC